MMGEDDSQDPGTGEKPSILIVEDDVIVTEDLKGKLQRLGFEICGTAEGGEQAIELVSARRPDLVLMDIHLKGAMDGIEAATLIRRDSDIPVVYLTAHSDRSTLERARITEPFGYLLKPFEDQLLEMHLQMALFKHRAERKLRLAEAQSRADAERLGAVLEAQREIARANLPYANLLELVLASMSRLTAAEGASLEVVESDEMVYEAASGFAAPFVGLRLKKSGSLSGLCMTSAKLLRSDDVETDPRVDLASCRRIGLRSMILLPLRYDEHSFGVLKLMSSRVEAFTADTEHTLQLMGEFLSAIIARKRIEDRLAESLRELQEAQKELMSRERLATLGKLAGSIAHEIRTPLTVIQNDLFFLEQVFSGDDRRVHEVFAEMKRAVSSSDHIISEMLDYVREPAAFDADFAVGASVSRALQWVPIPECVRVERPTAEMASIPVHANEEQVTRILVNLIQNAVQAMPRGGELAIAVNREGEGGVCVSVRDTGCGIPAENMERIFEPLFSTKVKGIGLGLAIALRYAQLNGGNLAVESEAGSGTVFRLRLRAGTQ